MKYRTLFIVTLAASFAAHADQVKRTNENFNHGWEMYPIPSEKLPELDFTIREGTSFEGQFDHKHIPLNSESAKQAAQKEVVSAVNAYESEYPDISGKKWEEVSLPHPVRYEEKLNPAGHHFSGICYYRKQFTAPQEGQSWIKFEGAMQQATVWVNGQYVMQNQGGYLPFAVYLNPYVKKGEENTIIIRLDNRDNPNTPPGRPLNTNGFLYWSGIYRSVSLVTTSDIHITDPVLVDKVAGGGVFVRYENVSTDSADLVIKSNVMNSGKQKGDISITHELVDNKGKTVAVSDSSKAVIEVGKDIDVLQTVKVANPALWSPDKPNLYTLVTKVTQGGKVVDSLSQRIGIRSLEMTREGGFKLNGVKTFMTGTNRHEDHPYIGNSLSRNATYRDLKQIKDAGMNAVRVGHYPNSPDVYDICDEIGLFVINPIPGWQFFNNNDIFKERVFRDIRQLIRRDRNHPCVVLWEASLNESYPPDEFRIKSAQVAHEEYPGDQFFTCGDTYAAKKTGWDVAYSLWGGDPFRREQPVQPDKPAVAREYGDYEFGGAKSTTRRSRKDGEEGLLQNAWNWQWEYNSLCGEFYDPWNIGVFNWAFYDGFETFHPDITLWGIVDVFRVPKFAWYFFASQRTAGTVDAGEKIQPMVYVANWWTEREKGKVVTYSNCDEIELFINGKSVARQKPDSGPETVYGEFYKGGNPFDGGNGDNLKHPPFTFMDIPWESGELKAVGYIGGKKVTEYTVKTPGKPVALKLYADTRGVDLAADGADVIFIHACLVDQNGTTVCLDNETPVTFEVEGEAMLPGPPAAKVEGGIASTLIRSTTRAGEIKVKASSEGYGDAVITVVSKPEAK